MHEAPIGELAKFISIFVPAEKVIEEHQPTPDGKCSCCKAGEYTRMPWPCATHKAAVHAVRSLVPSRRVG